MRGLPGCGSRVPVGPPLSASAPSAGSPALCMSVAAVKPHDESSEKLNPLEVVVPPVQFVLPNATTDPNAVRTPLASRMLSPSAALFWTTVAYTNVTFPLNSRIPPPWDMSPIARLPVIVEFVTVTFPLDWWIAPPWAAESAVDGAAVASGGRVAVDRGARHLHRVVGVDCAAAFGRRVPVKGRVDE